MVECLLDDTIRFVEFAKKNKKRLKTINIANDFNYKEENLTIIHENQESIVSALDFIQKYLDEREKK